MSGFHQHMQADQMRELSTRIAKTCLAFRDEFETPVDVLMFGSARSLSVLIARCTANKEEALTYVEAAKQLLDQFSAELIAVSFNEDGSKKDH